MMTQGSRVAARSRQVPGAMRPARCVSSENRRTKKRGPSLTPGAGSAAVAEKQQSSSKVVVITGASSGIGASVARVLGAGGHRLVLAARREDALKEVARDAGSDARTMVTDVRKRGDIERLRDEAVRAFGRVDVWISNAGRGISKPTLELTDEEFDEMMTVNVKSAL